MSEVTDRAKALQAFTKILNSLTEEDIPDFTEEVIKRLNLVQPTNLTVKLVDTSEQTHKHCPKRKCYKKEEGDSEEEEEEEEEDASSCCGSDCEEEEEEEEEEDSIVDRAVYVLRTMVPISALSPEEEKSEGKTVVPKFDPNKRFDGYSTKNTIHVDAFLYTDDDVQDLCSEGKLECNYCKDCGSTHIEPLNFVSHSASQNQLNFIFGPNFLLRRGENLAGCTVVDVGSRLGAVLYVAWNNTRADKIIGIELNPWFCKVQNEVIHERIPEFGDRISIVQGSVLDHGDILAGADVVVLNNVFEFFTESKEAELEAWRFLIKNVSKKGARVVTIPSLEESAKKFGKEAETMVKSWVKKVVIKNRYRGIEDEDVIEELEDIHLYVVN